MEVGELTNDIEGELWELQAHLSELILRLSSQHMRPVRPEASNRLPDGIILLWCGSIDVSGICDLTLGTRLDAVDLAVSQLLELGHAELVSQDVDASVLEELVACGVEIWGGWVVDEAVGVGDLLWEVLASVEELEEASDGIEWLIEVKGANLVPQLAATPPIMLRDSCRLITYSSAWTKLRTRIREPWALLQESLVRAQDSGVMSLSDVKLDDWAGKVVDVSKTNWDLDILLLLGCEWKAIAVLDGARCDDLNISVLNWSAHLDVGGLVNNNRWAVDFGLGHCECGVVKLCVG